MSAQMKRWCAIATYRSESGSVDVTHEIEELEDLHDLIERGPDWNAIVDIRITLISPVVEGFTLEDGAAVGQMTGDEYDAWIAKRRSPA